jgi:hypothetical protein
MKLVASWCGKLVIFVATRTSWLCDLTTFFICPTWSHKTFCFVGLDVKFLQW